MISDVLDIIVVGDKTVVIELKASKVASKVDEGRPSDDVVGETVD